jgi:hypothetical protein
MPITHQLLKLQAKIMESQIFFCANLTTFLNNQVLLDIFPRISNEKQPITYVKHPQKEVSSQGTLTKGEGSVQLTSPY